jgi:transcriptional regulator NrdR family protein
MSDIVDKAQQCPKCDTYNTQRVHVEWIDGHAVEEVRICNECPVEYTVEYADPRYKNIREEPPT